MENDEAKRPNGEEEGRRAALTLALFDLYWFRSVILIRPPPPPSSTPSAAAEIEDSESRTSSPTPASLRLRRLSHRRSLSDDLSPPPALQIHPPKLKTILSGKEPAPSDDEIPMFEVTVEEHEQRWRKRGDRRRRRRRRSESSKSLSELEFEELKGFLDLGFTFSDAEADPRLMEIVPGLQRLKAAGDKEPLAEAAGDEEASSCASAYDAAVSRPYLSEAWDAMEEEEVNRLRNFKIPIAEDGSISRISSGIGPTQLLPLFVDV